MWTVGPHRRGNNVICK